MISISNVLSRKKVTKIMTRAPLDSVESDFNVVEAAKMMRDGSRGSLLIMEGGKPIGIVTKGDIIRRVVAENSLLAERKVKDIMSTPLIVIEHNCSVSDAAEKMQENHIRRLAVTDNDKIIGIVTVTDIAGAVAVDSEKDESLFKAVMRSSYPNY